MQSTNLNFIPKQAQLAQIASGNESPEKTLRSPSFAAAEAKQAGMSVEEFVDTIAPLKRSATRSTRSAPGVRAYDFPIWIDRMVRARYCLRKGNFAEAVTEASEAITISRFENASSLFLLAEGNRHLNKHAEAIQSYNEALAIDPNLVDAREGRLVSLRALADAESRAGIGIQAQAGPSGTA